jgi:uncharacterized membrane protein YgdD (TMEM256/DUF423 family)
MLLLSSFLGATGVALGALGAHTLKSKIGLDFTTEQLGAFDTATKYQLLHAIALLVICIKAEPAKSNWLRRCSKFFAAGTFLFSGSIYFLSTQKLLGITIPKIVGLLTPVGGVLLIAGWVCLTLHAYSKEKS